MYFIKVISCFKTTLGENPLLRCLELDEGQHCIKTDLVELNLEVKGGRLFITKFKEGRVDLAIHERYDPFNIVFASYNFHDEKEVEAWADMISQPVLRISGNDKYDLEVWKGPLEIPDKDPFGLETINDVHCTA